MCQYCKKPNKTIVTHLLGVSAFVGSGRLWLRFDDDKCKRTIVNSTSIEYCPMCGHKMTKAK